MLRARCGFAGLERGQRRADLFHLLKGGGILITQCLDTRQIAFRLQALLAKLFHALSGGIDRRLQARVVQRGQGLTAGKALPDVESAGQPARGLKGEVAAVAGLRGARKRELAGVGGGRDSRDADPFHGCCG